VRQLNDEAVLDPEVSEGERAPDYFCELLDFVMPWAGGQAVLLTAFIDASERDNGIFCVGALAFGSDRAKKATRHWRELWGDTQCHMTDLHTRKVDPFKQWTRGIRSLLRQGEAVHPFLSFLVLVF
jgi:hypothetical protein